MARTGRLNPEWIKRGFSALARFAALARSMDIAPLTCVATAAVREAEDGPAFQRRVENEDRPEAARDSTERRRPAVAQGVLLGCPDAKGLVCDIGGNSMELAEVADGKVGRRVTSQLGPVPPAAGRPRISCARHITTILQGLAEKMGTDHDRI